MRRLSFKCLSALLAVLMLVSATSMVAFAADSSDGFTQTIFSFDAADEAYASYVDSGTNMADVVTNSVSNTKKAPLVTDPDYSVPAIKLVSGASFGMIRSALTNSNFRYSDDTPKLVKLEAEFRRSVSSINPMEVRVAVGGTSYETHATIWCSSSNNSHYLREGDKAPANTGKAHSTSVTRDTAYHTLTMYFDFSNKKQYAYIDGVKIGNAEGNDIIPSATNFTGLYLYSSRNTSYLKSIKISTIGTYTATGVQNVGEMYEYEYPNVKGLAYPYENESDEEKTFTFINAKYDSNGALVRVDANTKTVAAGDFALLTSCVEKGYEGKFFMWEGFNTMKPLMNVITVSAE